MAPQNLVVALIAKVGTMKMISKKKLVAIRSRSPCHALLNRSFLGITTTLFKNKSYNQH